MLATEMRDLKQQFFEELACASQAALLLDYDGTLAPFRVERERAFPYPAVVSLVTAIMSTGRTRVVLVSGRPAREVASILGITPHPEIWGAQGLERLRPDGSYEMPELSAETAAGIAEAGRWLSDRRVQQFAELKPGSLAVHWRGLSSKAAAGLRQKVLKGWQAIAQARKLTLMDFDGGLEIRTPIRNKGDAVQTILEELGDGVPVAYLGDDETDEDAFRALQSRGLTVLVRKAWRKSCAELWLRPPGELEEFLNQWLSVCH